MGDTPDNIIPITPDVQSAAEKFGAEHDRELLTILFTDLVDSTKLQSELGNVMAAGLVELHRKIVRDALAEYDAREIEWAGDSCLAVFTKPSDAVVFALRMQSEHRRIRRDEANLPLVRVGIHLGEIIIKQGPHKDDVFGLQVSETARVMSMARGEQIYCTRTVFDNARTSLKGAPLEGVGPVVWLEHRFYEVKGAERPIEICEVGENDLAPFKPPVETDKCKAVSADRQLTTVQIGEGRASKGQRRLKLAGAAVILALMGTLACSNAALSTTGSESGRDSSG